MDHDSDAEEVIHEDPIHEEDDEGEDLYGDNFVRDYAEDPNLDVYDPAMLDDTNIVDDPEARARAEAELDAREGRAPRVPMDDEIPQDEETARDRERRSRFQTQAARRVDASTLDQAKEKFPPCDGRAWNDEIRELFCYVCKGVLLKTRTYDSRIATMVKEEKTSFVVEWDDIVNYSARLGDWISNFPDLALEAFHDVASEITQSSYPDLLKHARITVRLGGYEAFENLRSLRTANLNRLVAVEGICIRRTGILPRLRVVYLECLKCGCDSNGPFKQLLDRKDFTKRRCHECQATGPFMVNRGLTVYESYQKLVIQEPPGSIKAGHMPRQKQVIVLGDIVDSVRPGDEVIVVGIYQTRQDNMLNAKSGFPVFQTQIFANNIIRKDEAKMKSITEEDVETILALSRNPCIREKIIRSIAPSLWGMNHVKTAIAYSLFGGVRKVSENHTVRGDINVLILGDPGLAKSQFLKYVETVSQRSILTTGKGASAVGLTAAVKRDPSTGEWTLEGGALVLADDGICMIDEFDKMSDKDRVSIHEAMEQQSISISKAGIVTSLRARCSIIAAANPIFGRYDTSLTFSENVDLTEPILSRFDVLAVLKDQISPINDTYLADYVVGSHMQSHPEATAARNIDEMATTAVESKEWIKDSGPIPQDMLRKYIFYARKHSLPAVRHVDQQSLAEFYSQIRQVAMCSGGMPMTVRHLESIMRMATANAKMRLSRYVEKRDMDHAISTMLESFIQSQQYAVANSLSKRFGRYRILACTVDEFIETTLTDLLNLKSRRVQNDADVFETPEVAQATLAELVEVCKGQHGIPEAAVQTYLKSKKFEERFSTTMEDDLIISSKIRA